MAKEYKYSIPCILIYITDKKLATIANIIETLEKSPNIKGILPHDAISHERIIIEVHDDGIDAS